MQSKTCTESESNIVSISQKPTASGLTPDQEINFIRFMLLVVPRIGSSNGMDILAQHPSRYWNLCWSMLEVGEVADLIRILDVPLRMSVCSQWRLMSDEVKEFICRESQVRAISALRLVSTWTDNDENKSVD